MKSIRAVAVIIHEEKLLLIWRKYSGKEYYVFPGGGVEDNETVEQAVLREVKEETSLEVKIDKLLYHHHYINDSDQYFYLCTYISGEPLLGDANEKMAMEKNLGDLFEPIWIEIIQLKNLLIYPLEIRDWLIEDIATNFQQAPREAQLRVEELRQNL